MHDYGGHNNTDYPSDDENPSADALNNRYNDGYNDARYNNKYNNEYYSYDDNYGCNNDGYYNDSRYHSHSHHNNGYNTDDIDRIVEEFESNLHLLWDTFLSLSTNHTLVGHQLN